MLRAALLLALAALAWPAASMGAARISRFTANFVPIAGYPETGNIYGAGADLVLEYRIAPGPGEAQPPALTDLQIVLPAGTTTHAGSFAQCAPPQTQPACPEEGRAGPARQATVYLPGESVLQPGTIEPYLGEEGTIRLAVIAGEPARQVLGASSTLFESAGEGGTPASPGIDLQFTPVPPVAAVPVASARLRIGAARGPGNPLYALYYFNVPNSSGCSRGGFTFTSLLTFAGGQQARAGFRAACPLTVGQRQGVTPCVGTHLYVVDVARPRVAYRRVWATVGTVRLPVRRGRTLTVPVDLRGAPRGTYTVKVTFLTPSGRTIVRTRRLEICGATPGGG